MGSLGYKPLDLAKREIGLLRALSYDERERELLRRESIDALTPRLSLETVSLYDFTEESKAYTKANHTDPIITID